MTSNARNLSKLLGSSTTVPSIRLDPVVNQNISNALTLAEAPPTQGLNDVGDLPLSGNDIGDQAYVASTGRMYIWTGSGWYNIALINNSPAFDSGGTPDPLYTLDSYNGSPTIIQLFASDPEEVPVQWNYVASDSAQYFATIQQDSSVFTITALPTPTIGQYDSAGGTFSVTFKASDGVNLAAALSEFTISFTKAGAFELSAYSGLSYVTSLTTSAEASPQGVFAKPDGTKLYIVGLVADAVHEYTLSTPWDVSTGLFNSSFSVTAQENRPFDLYISPNGDKLYIVGDFSDSVHEYTLSTPWDITTASYISPFSFVTQMTGAGAVSFKPDGTKMYLGGYSNNITQYTLATPWSVATATYDSISLTIGQGPQGLSFSPSGDRFFILTAGDYTIASYEMSTLWDVSTGVKSDYMVSARTNEVSSTGLYIDPTVSRLLYIGSGGDTVYQYDILSQFDYSYTSRSSFSVSPQDINPTGLGFKPDGTKMYMVGYSSDKVNQYTLSTPWDITTAAYDSISFSILAQDPVTADLFISPNGDKFYTTGEISDSIHEYTMSIPWDLSTSAFTTSFSVSVQEGGTQGVYFKPDGTKMYMLGWASDRVHQYTLSTPWSVATATYDSISFLISHDPNPKNINFNPDGTKMYIGGGTNASIAQYDLLSAWDISTSVLSRNYFGKIGHRGNRFNEKGDILYVIEATATDDVVAQYTL